MSGITMLFKYKFLEKFEKQSFKKYLSPVEVTQSLPHLPETNWVELTWNTLSKAYLKYTE